MLINSGRQIWDISILLWRVVTVLVEHRLGMFKPLLFPAYNHHYKSELRFLISIVYARDTKVWALNLYTLEKKRTKRKLESKDKGGNLFYYVTRFGGCWGQRGSKICGQVWVLGPLPYVCPSTVLQPLQHLLLELQPKEELIRSCREWRETMEKDQREKGGEKNPKQIYFNCQSRGGKIKKIESHFTSFQRSPEPTHQQDKGLRNRGENKKGNQEECGESILMQLASLNNHSSSAFQHGLQQSRSLFILCLWWALAICIHAFLVSLEFIAGTFKLWFQGLSCMHASFLFARWTSQETDTVGPEPNRALARRCSAGSRCGVSLSELRVEQMHASC